MCLHNMGILAKTEKKWYSIIASIHWCVFLAKW